jgi:hypothetical protein
VTSPRWRRLRDAWAPAGAIDDAAFRLDRELEARVRALEAASMAESAVPCPRCEGVEFAVSRPFRMERLSTAESWIDSPLLRMWACRGCGAIALVLDDRRSWIERVPEVEATHSDSSSNSSTDGTEPFANTRRREGSPDAA